MIVRRKRKAILRRILALRVAVAQKKVLRKSQVRLTPLALSGHLQPQIKNRQVKRQQLMMTHQRRAVLRQQQVVQPLQRRMMKIQNK